MEIMEALEEYHIRNAEEKEKEIKAYIKEIEEKREWGKLVSSKFKENSELIIADSLILTEAYNTEKKAKIIDIGSGGGIVGVIISIVCENWEVAMVEKSKKKSAFLAEMKAKLGLTNAEVLNMDARELAGVKEYDISVTRAAGRIKDVLPLGLGLVKGGGRYMAIKGSNVDEEVREAEEAIQANGGRLVEIIRKGRAEGGDRGRVSLVVIEKVM